MKFSNQAINTKIVVLTILLSVVIFSGCYYDKEEELYPNSVKSTDCNAVLTYNNGIKTIFDANCAISGCHVNGFTLPYFTNYATIQANLSKITLRAITQKNMPAPAGMSACNTTKLDNWIKAGAPEN